MNRTCMTTKIRMFIRNIPCLVLMFFAHTRCVRSCEGKSNCILVSRGRALFGQHQESRPLGRSNQGPTLEVRDSWTFSSNLSNLIGWPIRNECSENRVGSEVAILSGDESYLISSDLLNSRQMCLWLPETVCDVIFQKRVRVFHRGFQTREN